MQQSILSIEAVHIEYFSWLLSFVKNVSSYNEQIQNITARSRDLVTKVEFKQITRIIKRLKTNLVGWNEILQIACIQYLLWLSSATSLFSAYKCMKMCTNYTFRAFSSRCENVIRNENEYISAGAKTTRLWISAWYWPLSSPKITPSRLNQNDSVLGSISISHMVLLFRKPLMIAKIEIYTREMHCFLWLLVLWSSDEDECVNLECTWQLEQSTDVAGMYVTTKYFFLQ